MWISPKKLALTGLALVDNFVDCVDIYLNMQQRYIALPFSCTLYACDLRLK